MNENWLIPDANLEGVWFVDMGAVNLDDLVNSKPGQIVRCHYLPAVQYVPPFAYHAEHLAGLISDAA